MPVATIDIDGQMWHQGRSVLSGYRTRLFSDPEDAIAEENWLDGQWRDACAYWSARAVVRQKVLEIRAWMIVDGLCRDLRLGCKLVKLEPEDTHLDNSLSIWRSNNLDDVANSHLTWGDRESPSFQWVGHVEDKFALRHLIEKLTPGGKLQACLHGKPNSPADLSKRPMGF